MLWALLANIILSIALQVVPKLEIPPALKLATSGGLALLALVVVAFTIVFTFQLTKYSTSSDTHGMITRIA